MFNNRLQNQVKGDDFGFTSRYSDKTKRVVNKDGSFNVKRLGEKKLAFHTLITMPWSKYFLFYDLDPIVIKNIASQVAQDGGCLVVVADRSREP